MAVVDTMNPVQRVSCDLCGTQFDRQLDMGYLSFNRGAWRDASIAIWPGQYWLDERDASGKVRVEHACRECQEKFTEEVRALISRMTTVVR